MPLTLTKHEQFDLDLLDSGRSYGVMLKPQVAVDLLQACHRRYQRLGYKPARNQVLEDAFILGLITAEEWEAYKDFVDRRFLRRARAALALKHRPKPPLEAYEDGHH